ncbi:hypothetical protein SAMN04487926_112161 [Paraburkholderia steynii]|uniref:Uncharacterized protein n=1 Tax=Paraburkholderia steynii TaxID=1245441 RepID=A0A7Z7B946_9BURK|nr:hypothetical protein SAMN04487926_112161 [Paraburkholderia steynii]
MNPHLKTHAIGRHFIDAGTAGGHADFSVLKRFTIAAGEAVSVFAQKLGLGCLRRRERLKFRHKAMRCVCCRTRT